MGTSGLKIEALRRFNGDEFCGVGLKLRVFTPIHGKPAQLHQNRFPVGALWSDIHLFYEHPEDGIKRNIPGRQMGVADFSTSNLCPLLQV